MSRSLLVAALLSCWGCAFSLDGPDPKRPRNRVPRCDTSKGLVALDGVMATAFGVTALAVSSEEPAVALFPLALGALYVGGAISGNRSVDACRRAIAEYEQSYTGERYALDEQDDEDDIDRDDGDGRRKGLIPRPQQAGQPTQPPHYPPPYQAPYPQQQGAPAQPPTYAPPTYPAPGQQPPQQQPVAQPQPQQPVAPPQQQPVAQPPRPAKRPKAAPKQEEADDEWSDFWREVP
jgi:hypothetical protein